MRSLRSAGVMLALGVLASAADAQLVWDGIVQAPVAAGKTPGEYLVCPPGTNLHAAENLCLTGVLLPSPKGAPLQMSLQQALDMHFKAPAGVRAQAIGPMQVFDRAGVEKDRLGIAYKLIKQ
ncbi:hypothetical protein [Burkholderia ubonensis]|uniref:hypothetical protein n=1 Tax=Burkholderia ubonensis TaxID=101571 RepID=UPI000A93C413|nr:hypothetical protein [Burkholderia ubonensis]